MNRFAGSPRRGRGGWIALLALGSLLLACGPAGLARAQRVTFDEAPSDVGRRVYDYFARSTDPATTTLLQTVERYHLSESFWRYYREGALNSARSDLQYVLAYFPNHPRALHLIAYDKNVKLDPSLVIQHFELAIRSFPRRAYTYAQYGRYLLSIGRRNVGIALLDEAIRLDPDLLVARAWRAREENAQPRSEVEPSRGAAGKRGPSTSPEGPPKRTR